jgi:hypothetical protein
VRGVIRTEVYGEVDDEVDDGEAYETNKETQRLGDPTT